MTTTAPRLAAVVRGGRLGEADRHRAGWLLLVLGAALVVALAPFMTGLIMVPVLYVILEPVQLRLLRRMPARAAAGLTTALAVLLLITPAVLAATLVVGQARDVALQLTEGPVLARLQALTIGGFSVGALAASAGAAALGWLGESALGLLGTVTLRVLNLLIALFGFYYLLLKPGETWQQFTAYLPFSAATIERLRSRFRSITTSTIIGTGLVALLQGLSVGLALWAAGIANASFWALVTVVLSILPVVGSGLVWGPAAVWLLANDRPVAAIVMTLWGIVLVGNMDFFIRPAVSRRWAHVHPVITLVGALAGVRYFGLLGLLIGPLALSCFFEILRAYRTEYAPAG